MDKTYDELKKNQGPSIILERQEKISIEKSANYYIKHTKHKVRELFTGAYNPRVPKTTKVISPRDCDNSSDTKLERTACQLQELNSRIEYEIDKLKEFRNCLMHEKRSKKNVAMSPNKSTWREKFGANKLPLSANCQELGHENYTRPLKYLGSPQRYSGEEERRIRHRLRTIGLKNAILEKPTAKTSPAASAYKQRIDKPMENSLKKRSDRNGSLIRRDRSGSSPGHDKRERTLGGCTYGHNESMQTTYQADYSPNCYCSNYNCCHSTNNNIQQHANVSPVANYGTRENCNYVQCRCPGVNVCHCPAPNNACSAYAPPPVNTPVACPRCDVLVCCCPTPIPSGAHCRVVNDLNAQEICRKLCSNVVQGNEAVTPQRKSKEGEMAWAPAGQSFSKKQQAKRTSSKSPARVNKPKVDNVVGKSKANDRVARTKNADQKSMPKGNEQRHSQEVGLSDTSSLQEVQRKENALKKQPMSETSSEAMKSQPRNDITPADAADATKVEQERQETFEAYVRKYKAEETQQKERRLSKSMESSGAERSDQVKVGTTYTKLGADQTRQPVSYSRKVEPPQSQRQSLDESSMGGVSRYADQNKRWREGPCACIRELENKRAATRYADYKERRREEPCACIRELQSERAATRYADPNERWREVEQNRLPKNEETLRYNREKCACVYEFERERGAIEHTNPKEPWRQEREEQPYYDGQKRLSKEEETQVTPVVSSYDREQYAGVNRFEKERPATRYANEKEYSRQEPCACIRELESLRGLTRYAEPNEPWREKCRQEQESERARYFEGHKRNSKEEKTFETQVTPTTAKYNREKCACIYEYERDASRFVDKKVPRRDEPYLEQQPERARERTRSPDRVDSDSPYGGKIQSDYQFKSPPSRYTEKTTQVTPSVSRNAEGRNENWEEKHTQVTPSVSRNARDQGESWEEKQTQVTPSVSRNCESQREKHTQITPSVSRNGEQFSRNGELQAEPSTYPRIQEVPRYADTQRDQEQEASPYKHQEQPTHIGPLRNIEDLPSGYQTPKCNSLSPNAHYESATKIKEYCHYERYGSPPSQTYQSRGSIPEHSPVKHNLPSFQNLQDSRVPPIQCTEPEATYSLQPEQQPSQRNMQPMEDLGYRPSTAYNFSYQPEMYQPYTDNHLPQQPARYAEPHPMTDSERAQYRRDIRAAQQRYQDSATYADRPFDCSFEEATDPSQRTSLRPHVKAPFDSTTSICRSYKKVTTVTTKTTPMGTNHYMPLSKSESNVECTVEYVRSPQQLSQPLAVEQSPVPNNRQSYTNASLALVDATSFGSGANSRYVPQACKSLAQNKQRSQRAHSSSPSRSRPTLPMPANTPLPYYATAPEYERNNNVLPQPTRGSYSRQQFNTPEQPRSISNMSQYYPMPRDAYTASTHSQMPNTSTPRRTVCTKEQVQSMLYEDGNQFQNCKKARSVTHSPIDWDRGRQKAGLLTKSYTPYDRDQTPSYQPIDEDDILTTRTASSGNTLQTCVETRLDEDYITCDETETGGNMDLVPPFKGCPCMYDTYLNMAAVCASKKRAIH